MFRSKKEQLTDYVEAIQYAPARQKRVNLTAWSAVMIAGGLLAGLLTQEVHSRITVTSMAEDLAAEDGFLESEISIGRSSAPYATIEVNLGRCSLTGGVEITRAAGLPSDLTYTISGYVNDQTQTLRETSPNAATTETQEQVRRDYIVYDAQDLRSQVGADPCDVIHSIY